jgi:hypothetical protein
MKSKSRFQQKLELVSVPIAKSTDTVKAIAISPKKKEKSTSKGIQCYIYMGRLKAFPKILITQLRYEAFDSVEDCTAWCEEHCTAYEIKDHKKSKTLVKKQ